MNDILVSPTDHENHLLACEDENDDDIVDEENLIKIKLFFFADDKKLRARVFPEEWYTVLADEFGEDQVTRDFQPWIEVSSPLCVLWQFADWSASCSVPYARLRDIW